MPSAWARQQPGREGLSTHSISANEAAWLQNWDVDREGLMRPRDGLKHIKDMGGAVTDISKLSGYNAKLMVVSNGGSLDALHVESAAVTSVDTGWPTTPISKCIAVAASGTNVWVAPKSPVGGTVGTIYKYDGTTLTALAPPSGNYVGMHQYVCMRAASGDGSGNALRWSGIGDIDSWLPTRGKAPIPEIGTLDAIVPYSSQQTLLVGPYGIGHVLGTDPDNLSFEPLVQMLILTPMHHVCKCRDRVILLAAGPRIVQFIPPGVVRDISPPIFRDLYLAQGLSNIRTWFDSRRNEFCFSDRTRHYTYRYSLDQERWIGVFKYAGVDLDLLGAAVVDQGASTVDAATQPWGKSFVAAGNHVLQWDPSIATDATSSSNNTQFVCVVETPPIVPDPAVEHKVYDLQVEGAGTYAAYLKGRNTPGGSWTTHSLGNIQCPNRKRVSPQLPSYREIALRIEASSAVDLRFESLSYRIAARRRP